MEKKNKQAIKSQDRIDPSITLDKMIEIGRAKSIKSLLRKNSVREKLSQGGKGL